MNLLECKKLSFKNYQKIKDEQGCILFDILRSDITNTQ